MTPRVNKSWSYGLWLILLVSNVFAADPPVAVVNGVSISARLMERNVRANVAKGQNDTPALRAALKEELIARELMVQDALRLGLDKRQESEDSLHVLRQNYLIDVLVQEALNKSPVTDAELKAEYERQVQALNAGNLQQYHLATIVLESEIDARNVMAALRTGQVFESLASEKSVDSSKERGGDLGWLLADQITPVISNVVVNLQADTVSAVPIAVGPYWHVVKLLAKRPFKVPGFVESRELVFAAVMQNRRMAIFKRLESSAKIIR